MGPLDIANLQDGQRVEAELRVIERSERKKADGEPYVILTLGNASGQIDTEPIWADKLDAGWADGAARGSVVQVLGHVGRYARGGASRRQLRLSAPARTLPREAYRLDDFLPHVAQDPAALWDRLDHLRREIASSSLKGVLALLYDDEPFRLRFERAPASVGGHHSAVGGLLLHVWEVAYIGRTAARALRANADLVVAGALLHDVGKVEAYDVSWDGFVRTAEGHLLEHVVLGLLMLERRMAALEQPPCTREQYLELQHMILSHHGALEFGSPVRPLTPEAEILHYADEASAKGASMIEGLGDDEAFRDGAVFGDRSRLWRVDRRALWRRGHEWE